MERSRRPKSSLTRLPAEVEALICELRRAYPRWGPRFVVIAQVVAQPSGQAVCQAFTD